MIPSDADAKVYIDQQAASCCGSDTCAHMILWWLPVQAKRQAVYHYD